MIFAQVDAALSILFLLPINAYELSDENGKEVIMNLINIVKNYFDADTKHFDNLLKSIK